MGSTSENLTPSAINSLTKELNQLQTKPEEGIRVFINEENIADIQAEFDGPNGTPYEGGVFRMKLVLPAEFPSAAPKGFFLTKIFHPNIRTPSGEICVNTLKKDWQPTHGIRHILQVIRCLLIEPFPESALNEDAAKMLLEDYEGYAKHARMLTDIHAKARRADGDDKLSVSVARAEGGGAAEDAEGGDLASPMKKKAKAEKNSKQKLERKKSLKRL